MTLPLPFQTDAAPPMLPFQQSAKKTGLIESAMMAKRPVILDLDALTNPLFKMTAKNRKFVERAHQLTSSNPEWRKITTYGELQKAILKIAAVLSDENDRRRYMSQSPLKSGDMPVYVYEKKALVPLSERVLLNGNAVQNVAKLVQDINARVEARDALKARVSKSRPEQSEKATNDYVFYMYPQPTYLVFLDFGPDENGHPRTRDLEWTSRAIAIDGREYAFTIDIHEKPELMERLSTLNGKCLVAASLNEAAFVQHRDEATPGDLVRIPLIVASPDQIKPRQNKGYRPEKIPNIGGKPVEGLFHFVRT